MKWLIDAQLPPQLCSWFRAQGEESLHVSEIASGLSVSDEFLWELAKRERWILVTKDRDFFERSLVYGPSPQVLFIRVGNCSNEKLFQILNLTKKDWMTALRENRPLVVLTAGGTQIF